MADLAAETSIERPFPRALVGALALSAMLTPLNSTMLSVVLGPIGRDFHAVPGALTQALVTSYLVTSLVMQAPAGKLGDRLGHRRTLAFGQIAFLVGSLAAYVAPSVLVLAIARVVMATGGALIVPSASALLRLELPPDARGRAFGAFGAAMALSAAIGPPLGGMLEARFGWRATFLVNLAVLPVAAAFARSDGTRAQVRGTWRGFRFDAVGSLLLGASLVAFVAAARLHGSACAVALVAGSAGMVAFVLWERGHPEPIVDLGLLRHRVFVAGGMIVAFQNLAMYAMLFEIPNALARILHFGPKESGRLLLVMMAGMGVASPIAGRLTDRLGARRVATSGAVAAIAGVVWLGLLPITDAWSVVPGMIAVGVGLGLSSSPSQASAMNAAPRESSGVAAAVLATMRYLGGVAGVVLLGLVLRDSSDVAVARADHELAMHCFGAALVLALGCSLVLPGRPATNEPATA